MRSRSYNQAWRGAWWGGHAGGLAHAGRGIEGKAMDAKPCLGICIMRSLDRDTWTVTLCRAPGDREEIGRFATREEAAAFALAERDRRRELVDLEPCIEVPDDCPCSRNR